MNRLSITQTGFAAGITAVALYIGCMVAVRILPQETLTHFFNALLHGLDVTPIIRHDVSPGDDAIGIVSWFIIAGALGIVFALVYNFRAAGPSAKGE